MAGGRAAQAVKVVVMSASTQASEPSVAGSERSMSPKLTFCTTSSGSPVYTTEISCLFCLVSS